MTDWLKFWLGESFWTLLRYQWCAFIKQLINQKSLCAAWITRRGCTHTYTCTDRKASNSHSSLSKALQVWSTPPALAISTAHHWYSFPAPNSPTVFLPLSLDRGPWVKRRGECSITTRSDPIKYRFNQPRGRRVNTQSDQAGGNWRPSSVGAGLRPRAGGLAPWVRRHLDPIWPVNWAHPLTASVFTWNKLMACRSCFRPRTLALMTP